MDEPLEFAIVTPHGDVFREAVLGARVPTESGLVGIRARGEPMALAVEAGLVVLRRRDGTTFAATAGGLLEAGRRRSTLYTPFAAAASSEDEMLGALSRMREAPSDELLARRRLGELEQRVLGAAGERERRPGRPTRRRRRRG